MNFDFSALNWGALLASVAAAQVVSTLWFVVLFGEPWAAEFGVKSKKEHAAAVPPYTYGVQVLCTIVSVVALALLHQALGVANIGEALGVGAFVIVGFVLSNGLPGQAFLKRWRVAALSLGCQATMILTVSIVLGLWR